MSSNAAAIRRRVTQHITPTPTPTPTSQPVKQLTIQQVLTTMDKRLTQVEQLCKTNNDTNNATDLTHIVDEFNNRFEMIVTEMNTLKDVIMQLQTFTMNVNKTLFDERIHILSDLGNESVIPSDNTELQSLSNSQDNLVLLEKNILQTDN
jgi:L-lactate utilization protein LutC